MATVIDITNTPGAAYIWSTSSWDWDGPEAAKSWPNLAISTWDVDVQETLDFVEAVVKVFKKLTAVTLDFTVSQIKNAQAVLYNLVFRNVAKDLAQMQLISKDFALPGTQALREMPPGTYEYQKAIIGIRVKAPQTGNRYGISDLVHHVDVPDLNERGNDVITDIVNPTSIALVKNFHIVPEVQVQVVAGATPSFAEVTNVTTSGFDVQLFDKTAPTTKVTGTISWAAVGY